MMDRHSRLRQFVLLSLPIVLCLLGLTLYGLTHRESPVLITLWGDPSGEAGSTLQIRNQFRNRDLEHEADAFLRLLVSRKYSDAFALSFASANLSYSEHEAEHPLTRYSLSSIDAQKDGRVLVYRAYRLVDGKEQQDEHIKFICRQLSGSWHIERISIVY